MSGEQSNNTFDCLELSPINRIYVDSSNKIAGIAIGEFFEIRLAGLAGYEGHNLNMRLVVRGQRPGSQRYIHGHWHIPGVPAFVGDDVYHFVFKDLRFTPEARGCIFDIDFELYEGDDHRGMGMPDIQALNDSDSSEEESDYSDSENGESEGGTVRRYMLGSKCVVYDCRA